MNRRGFLQLAAGAAAAFGLDPERALWTPKRYVRGADLDEIMRVTYFEPALLHRDIFRLQAWINRCVSMELETAPARLRLFGWGVTIGEFPEC